MELWTISFPAPGRVARMARRVEAQGWDGLLFTDSQHHNGDTYAALAIAASVTERIGLGTGVTNPVTRNPAVTASAILSVQVESGGRAVLGIGRGDSSLAHLGLEPAPVDQLEDYVTKVQRYLRGEPVEQNGHPARLKWIEGIAKPPVDIAATGPRVSELAGRVGDWITVAVGADVKRMRRNIELARTARERAGLDPGSLKCGAYLNLAAHSDVEVARRVARGSIGTMAHFSSMSDASVREVAEADRRVVRSIGESYELAYHGDVRARHLQAIDDSFVDRFAIVDTPGRCVERLRALLDAVPLERICVMSGSRGADPTEVSEVAECVASEVVPKLRAG
ncbi:MAG: LLM class flavin-dependent oxidoreductase [Myxococcota bacterium]